jgi:hypothetical protein
MQKYLRVNTLHSDAASIFEELKANGVPVRWAPALGDAIDDELVFETDTLLMIPHKFTEKLQQMPFLEKKKAFFHERLKVIANQAIADVVLECTKKSRVCLLDAHPRSGKS